MNKTNTLTKNKALRVSIDNNWSSSDFVNLFNSLNFLYKIFIELEFLDDSIEMFIEYKKENNDITFGDYFLSGVVQRALHDIHIVDGNIYKKLNYSSVSNNSKLVTDRQQEFTKTLLNEDRIDHMVFKVSKIKYASPGYADLVGIGKIVEEIFNLFKYYFPNKEGRLNQVKLEQDIISKKIENLKSLGVKDKELQKLFDVRNNSILNIKNLKLSDKITKIEIREIEGD